MIHSDKHKHLRAWFVKNTDDLWGNCSDETFDEIVQAVFKDLRPIEEIREKNS